jgi:NAD+ kinase
MVTNNDQLASGVLPAGGQLAAEADGNLAANVDPGDTIDLLSSRGTARIVRLGRTTFYERALRKLRLIDSAEISVTRQ